jgi:hypothetical protein
MELCLDPSFTTCVYIQFFIHGYCFFNVRPRWEERLGNLNIPQWNMHTLKKRWIVSLVHEKNFFLHFLVSPSVLLNLNLTLTLHFNFFFVFLCGGRGWNLWPSIFFYALSIPTELSSQGQFLFVWILRGEMIFVQPFYDNFNTTFSLILTWCIYPLSSFFSLYCFWPMRRKRSKVVKKVVIKWLSKYHYSIKS